MTKTYSRCTRKIKELEDELDRATVIAFYQFFHNITRHGNRKLLFLRNLLSKEIESHHPRKPPRQYYKVDRKLTKLENLMDEINAGTRKADADSLFSSCKKLKGLDNANKSTGSTNILDSPIHDVDESSEVEDAGLAGGETKPSRSKRVGKCSIS